MNFQDADNDFRFAKRKHMGTWINTGLYAQVWKAIAEKGDYADYDWIDRIKLLPAAPTGAFLADCDGVEYGSSGNLEGFSKHAVVTALMSF